MSESREFDVIVVGCGGAGLAAALAAQEKGGRVCILERASKEESGGNTRYTGAWMRMKSVESVSSDFEEHFAENAGGYLDPTVIADLDYTGRIGNVHDVPEDNLGRVVSE